MQVTEAPLPQPDFTVRDLWRKPVSTGWGRGDWHSHHSRLASRMPMEGFFCWGAVGGGAGTQGTRATHGKPRSPRKARMCWAW